MAARELAQCVLSWRGACTHYVGFALFLGFLFLIIAGALWWWRTQRGASRRLALWKSGLDAAIVISLGGIVLLTLGGYGRDSEVSLNLIPFGSILESLGSGDFGGDFYLGFALFELVANVALYVPLGFLIALRLVGLGLLRWIAIVVSLSVAIELIQAVLPSRSGDITDVITNSTGATLGFVAGRLIQRWRIGRTEEPLSLD